MIRYNGREIAAIHIGRKTITALYNGAVLIWQSVRSCFGSGWWIDDKPWLDDEGWKD